MRTKHMARQSPFYPEGVFYKGNLHMHSVVSDGCLTPDELKKLYRDRGYQFVVFSEHDIYSRYPQEDDGLLVIQGYEASFTTTPEEWRRFHLNVFPCPARNAQAVKPFYSHLEHIPIPRMEGLQTIQQTIDECLSRGYMVMVNHPGWSAVEYDEIAQLSGFFAIEVFNYGSEIIEDMGRGDVCWDALLRRGIRVWGTATDDNHNEVPLDNPISDSFGGWVCVKAKALDEDSICQALWDGSFYATQGPEIRDFWLEDGIAVVRCSPVSKIYLRADRRQTRSLFSPDKSDSLTEFSTKLRGDELYIRAECIDSSGRRAYSNPIFLR